MNINKMREYNADYEAILDELERLDYNEMVEELKRNPPKKSTIMANFGGTVKDVPEKIELVPLVDALLDAQQKTDSYGVSLHTLQSVMGQGADRKRLSNLRFLLQKKGSEIKSKWFKEVKR